MARKFSADIEAASVPAHLSCNHSLLFKPPYPMTRDVVWCKRCGKEVTVLGIADSYGITCDRCPRLNRRYGTDQRSARRAASMHVLKYPRHTITIRKGGQYSERIGNSGTQDELPFERVLTERAAQVAQSQRALREMTMRAIDKATTTGNVVTDQPAPLSHVPQEEP